MPDYRVTVIYKDGTARTLDRDIAAANPSHAAKKVLGSSRPFSTDPLHISSLAMTTPRSFKAACRWHVDPVTFKATKQGYDK